MYGLRGWFTIFAPRLQRILSCWDVLDFKIAVLVGHRKIRCRHHDDIARHFRMHVAQQRNAAEIIELERFLFALGPGAEIMSELFVAADRWPIYVVADSVAVQEVDRGPLLHSHDARDERHFPLVD